MTAGELAVVLVTVVAFAAFVVLLVAVLSLLRVVRELRTTLARVQAEALPAVAELRETAVEAGVEVERIDELLTTAESISATVEGASRIGYLAFRRPYVRAVAVSRGAGRGLLRLVGIRSKKSVRVDPGPNELGERRRHRRKAA